MKQNVIYPEFRSNTSLVLYSMLMSSMVLVLMYSIYCNLNACFSVPLQQQFISLVYCIIIDLRSLLLLICNSLFFIIQECKECDTYDLHTNHFSSFYPVLSPNNKECHLITKYMDKGKYHSIICIAFSNLNFVFSRLNSR